MKKKELLIENRLGLHARAAAQIVKTASGFSAKILLIKDGVEVDLVLERGADEVAAVEVKAAATVTPW